MRETLKRVTRGAAKAKKAVSAGRGDAHDLILRIRQRREEILRRTGTLSGSASLIREDRDR